MNRITKFFAAFICVILLCIPVLSGCSTKYRVSFDFPSETLGTVAVTIDNQPINHGTRHEKGALLKIAITPEAKQQVKSVKAISSNKTDDLVLANGVYTYTLKMRVTIKVEFEPKPLPEGTCEYCEQNPCVCPHEPCGSSTCPICGVILPCDLCGNFHEGDCPTSGGEDECMCACSFCYEGCDKSCENNKCLDQDCCLHAENKNKCEPGGDVPPPCPRGEDCSRLTCTGKSHCVSACGCV